MSAAGELAVALVNHGTAAVTVEIAITLPESFAAKTSTERADGGKLPTTIKMRPLVAARLNPPRSRHERRNAGDIPVSTPHPPAELAAAVVRNVGGSLVAKAVHTLQGRSAELLEVPSQ